MKRIIVLLVMLFLLSRGFLGAQSVTSAYDMAVAGADLFTPRAGYLEQNPATINQFQGHCIAIYQMAPYFISELTYNTLSLVINRERIPFALDYRLQSFAASRQHIWALSSGMKIQQGLSLGLKIRYELWSIDQESYAQSWLTEIGIIYELSKRLSLASQFQPIYQERFANHWFGQMQSGIQYQFSRQSNLIYALRMNQYNSLSQQLALSSQILQQCKVMLGISTQEPIANFGLQLQWKKFGFQNSYSYHSSLGLSTCVGILFQY